ncbi:hypothetical protein Pan258_05820 [Symmachiella dynata]|uniref:hypothetical protein n=1 Tax=Symmachiella dynata TaxID=2527995 RepID=UPI00118BFC6C|nr:hypothetical protein [Symmachiella dynata]QDT46563.1 hypothetical protein Pan258_05820 [Symmachiella dynata]
MRIAHTVSLCLVVVVVTATPLSAQLVQRKQDFSRDPGWDHFQNRIVGTEMPLVVQDFGWRETNFTGSGPGEIGGRVENSRRQAYYAIPLGKPLSFDDHLSASGKLTIKHIGLRGVGYIGFFNSQRHTWRVWSSMAFRIWEEDNLGQIMFDWMSSDWQARGAETAILLAADGKVHTWSFEYDPDAKDDPVWRDEALKKLITSETGNGRPYELQGEEHLLTRLKALEPDVTAKQLRERLLKLRDQGLVEYFHRHNQHRWWKRPEAGQGHGRITLTFDDETPYVIWFDETIRQAPVSFDRFGLFNIARFGQHMELYLGDLTINGEKIELSQDPHWEGHNNESKSVEPNFHGMHSYGWSQTHWAGQKPGEIGGLFWRTEPHDPLFSYYADDVGELTLDDPISFSGTICFADGMTDAAAYFGYFNRDDHMTEFERDDPEADKLRTNRLGFYIADRTAVGYNLKPTVSTTDGQRAEADCGVFTPDRKQHRFTFDYDPHANEGVGRITVSLDGVRQTFDLTPRMRKAGAKLNRFGLANIRSGGHSVEFYLDDLNYTARRSRAVKFIPQTRVQVPYPHEQAGRRY